METAASSIELCNINKLTRESIHPFNYSYIKFPSINICASKRIVLAPPLEGSVHIFCLSCPLAARSCSAWLPRIFCGARERLEKLGRAYLAEVRKLDPETRVLSLPSYEDGGLEKVFRAILHAPDWDEPSLRAFQHFLVGHIRLDSDPEAGHGSLCRHLAPDDRILPLWSAFRNLLVEAAPRLAS